MYRKKERRDKIVYDAKDLQRRYRKAKSNNFAFPEIKNVLDCIADVLSYYKANHYKRNAMMRRLIDQAIHRIMNASQETLCADITIDKCPPKNTISLITDARNKGFFNIKNENVIFRYGKQYCKNNVYETPYKGVQYPYAYCIRVMIQSLNVIELINVDMSAATATASLQDQFHYYLDYLLENAPNVFLVPTLHSLHSQDTRVQPHVQYIRCIPFGDLVWHDINQVRKIYQAKAANVWYSRNNLQKTDCYPHERLYDNVETGKRYNRVNLRFYEQGEL